MEPMSLENIISWLNGGFFSLERFIEKREKLIFVLIFLLGFYLRFLPLIKTGLPTDLPFNGGGLYYHFSETILENNFAYPMTVPYYTAEGIPFAYSPLLFYLNALIAKFTPLSTFILHVYLPTFISVATVIAFYFLARLVFQDRKLILFSTLVYSIIPVAFLELIPGEGLCESFGAFMFIIGLIFMYKMFSTNSRKYIIITGVLFGLTVLGSPGGGFAFLIALLVFSFLKGAWIFDIKKFIYVALIGAAISSPWWLIVINNHGIGVLINGFMSKQSSSILGFILKIINFDVFVGVFWAALCLFGIFYCLARRNFLLPILFLCFLFLGETGYIVPIIAVILVTFGLFKVVIPGFKKQISEANDVHRLLTASILIIILLHGIVVAFSCSSALAPAISEEKEGMEAMKWIKQNTEGNITFFVIHYDHGPVREWWLRDWFPAITHRTTLNAGFGCEWTEYRAQIVNMHIDLLKATEINDLIKVCDEYDVQFTHIFISKSQARACLTNRLRESENFKMLFENTGAIVFAKK